MPPHLARASNGLTALSSLLNSDPMMTLKIYKFGVLMQRKTETGEVQYLVDPQQLALQLAATVRLDTGLLSPHTIHVAKEGVNTLVVEHRPRKKTAIFLEGVEAPLVVPMPDMLMFRRTADQGRPEYRVFAVKERPTNLEAPLFHIPLPNVYSDGRICWGSVKQLKDIAPTGTALEEDWKVFLGTPFGFHSVSQKSKSHSEDIRKKYLDMEQRKTRVYPKSDLLPAKRTVHAIIGELLR